MSSINLSISATTTTTITTTVSPVSGQQAVAALPNAISIKITSPATDSSFPIEGQKQLEISGFLENRAEIVNPNHAVARFKVPDFLHILNKTHNCVVNVKT